MKGTWGADFVAEVAPADGDIVIEGKRGLDTFASTNIDFILRSKGIDTIILGGFLTNCCVESTMRTGYENGYRVITLTDCTPATTTKIRSARLRVLLLQQEHTSAGGANFRWIGPRPQRDRAHRVVGFTVRGRDPVSVAGIAPPVSALVRPVSRRL